MSSARPRSQLFTVRLARAEGPEGGELRGSVQEVLSGAYRSFRSWSELTEFLSERLGGAGRDDIGDEEREGER